MIGYSWYRFSDELYLSGSWMITRWPEMLPRLQHKSFVAIRTLTTPRLYSCLIQTCSACLYPGCMKAIPTLIVYFKDASDIANYSISTWNLSISYWDLRPRNPRSSLLEQKFTRSRAQSRACFLSLTNTMPCWPGIGRRLFSIAL